MTRISEQPTLSVPDRYESLRRKTSAEQIQSIVVPVHSALAAIDRRYGQMRSSHRGAFMVLRGDSGAGKSTFLHTINQFRKNVATHSVPGNVNIRDYFSKLVPSKGTNIYVLEEREAAVSFEDRELEEWLHSINGFLRTDRGEGSIVVWPCNTDELLHRVIAIAKKIGDTALLGTGDSYVSFSGPEKSTFISVAERTIAVLNEGATMSDLGISRETVEYLAEKSDTIGKFLGLVRDKIQEQEQYVQSLAQAEQCSLWIVAIAGNEPNQEVAGLTRGRNAAVDIERLLTATEANIVAELKSIPDRLGILATTLDARILHLPIITALALTRSYASDALKARMKSQGLSLTPSNREDAKTRLSGNEIGRIFAMQAQGVLTTGKAPGSSTIEAFKKLAAIAQTNDVILNRTIAEGFKDAGLIDSYELERDFGKGLTRRTDIVAKKNGQVIRVEMMWRSRTSRADIANYSLTKIANYGRALGFLG